MGLVGNPFSTPSAHPGRRPLGRRTAPPPDIAASYARYSSENQDAASIVQQQRNCHQRATGNGHRVPTELQFADLAVSGTRADRVGFQALLAAAREGRFGVLYVDSLSRLARELTIALPALKELTAVCGVRVVSVGENIDSASGNWELPAIVNSYMHQELLKAHAANVRRGRVDAFLNDRSNGDWCFGYRSEPIPGSEAGRRTRLPRMRLGIDGALAHWVPWAFERFATDGWSLIAIGRELSGRQVPRDHRAVRSDWSAKAIHRLLTNRKYIGVWTWGATEKHRNPLTGQTWQAPRADDDPAVLTRLRPDLRLVTDDLFSRAERRLAEQAERVAGSRNARGRLRGSSCGGRPRTLLAGVFRCGRCGNRFVRSGAKNYLRCAGSLRGECPCDTWLNIDRASRLLLGRLGNMLLDDPGWRAAVLATATAEWERATRVAPAERAGLERSRAELASKVARLVDGIEAGAADPDVRDRLRQRRAELSELDRHLRADRPVAPGEPPTEEFVRRQLSHLHDLLSGGGPPANTALRQLLGPVTVTESHRPCWEQKFLRGRCRPRTAFGAEAGDGHSGRELVVDFHERDAVDDQLEQVRRLVTAGRTSGQIAVELGLTRNRVTIHRNRLRRYARVAADAAGRATEPAVTGEPTDLTDAAWEVARAALAIPDDRKRVYGRPCVDRRRVLNAARHHLAGGRPWTALPCHFPRWELVRLQLGKWQASGDWTRLEAVLAAAGSAATAYRGVSPCETAGTRQVPVCAPAPLGTTARCPSSEWAGSTPEPARLADAEWAVVRMTLDIPDDRPHGRGRPPTDRRLVADAARYHLASGQPWAALPARFPSRRLVRSQLDAWRASGAWARAEATLSELAGRAALPDAPSAERGGVTPDGLG